MLKFLAVLTGLAFESSCDAYRRHTRSAPRWSESRPLTWRTAIVTSVGSPGASRMEWLLCG